MLNRETMRQKTMTISSISSGEQRILIRNVKNKIIRLSDSKCQVREGGRADGSRKNENLEEAR